MVEPISAVVAETAKVTVSVTKEALAESLPETVVGESPVQNTMQTIENSSLKTLGAQNEIPTKPITEPKIKQIEQNRENGALREEEAKQELEDKDSESEGYKIHPEEYQTENLHFLSNSLHTGWG